MSETLYTITVDTEEEWDWSSGYPTGSARVANIRELPRFQDVCDRLAAKVTYFVNYAVLSDPAAAKIILELAQRSGVEIGMHIHPWNTPPLSPKESVPTRESFLHNLPREEALRKLQTVHHSFVDRGLTPTSFRGGRYSSSPWIQQFLAERGVLADASVLPYTTWPDEGAPNFRQRGLMPVRQMRGDRPIWEIPLTMAFTRRPFAWSEKFYACAAHRLMRPLRMVGICERLGIVRRIWLNAEHSLGARMPELLSVLRPLQLPSLNITLHSSSLLPGANSYIRTADDLKGLFRRLQDAVSLLSSWSECRPATVSEVARQLEFTHHARSGN